MFYLACQDFPSCVCFHLVTSWSMMPAEGVSAMRQADGMGADYSGSSQLFDLHISPGADVVTLV